MKYAYGSPVSVSAGEISRNFGQWQDRALSGPVVVTHHGRPRVVLVSAEHYANWSVSTEAPADNEGSNLAFETSLAAVLDQLSDAFVSFDTSLNVAAANHVFEAMVGRASAQLIGRPWGSVFTAAIGSVIEEQLRRTLRTGEVVTFESDSFSGQDRRCMVRVFPYPGGVAALIRNRTAELDLEDRFAEARALGCASNTLPRFNSLALNMRGVISRVDDALLRTIGFSQEDLANVRLADIIRPRDRSEFTTAFETAMQTSRPVRFATTVLVKAGEDMPVQLGLAPILRHGVPVGAIVAILSLASEG